MGSLLLHALRRLLPLLILAAAPAWAVTAKDIHPERELLITATTVVDSEAAKYPGAWSFGALIEELVGAKSASECMRKWLESWTTPQAVGNGGVASRRGIREKIIVPWQKRDGYDPEKAGKPWEPQLAHAPFRLLAIVNRMDLCAPEVADSMKVVEDAWRLHGQEDKFRELLGLAGFSGGGFAGGYGFSAPRGLTRKKALTSAGEGRLVFGAVGSSGEPLEGGWTVIFEYDLPISLQRGLREWAQAWHQLGLHDLADKQFVVELEQLTRAFTHERPKLAQLRTSEAAFGAGREFRQFDLAEHEFAPAALSQTPAPVFGVKHSVEQRLLSQFLDTQEPLMRSGIHLLPSELPLRKTQLQVLGGSATIPQGNPNFRWELTSLVSRDARRTFSLNTCNGCHAGETGCVTGLHIGPRAEGQEAPLSTFLRRDGQSLRLNDPDVKGLKVEYAEMNDRAAILAALMEPRDRGAVVALRPILRARLSRTH